MEKVTKKANVNGKINKINEEVDKKGFIKTYDEFLQTKEAKEYALSKEEEIYYSQFDPNQVDENKQ